MSFEKNFCALSLILTVFNLCTFNCFRIAYIMEDWHDLHNIMDNSIWGLFTRLYICTPLTLCMYTAKSYMFYSYFGCYCMYIVYINVILCGNN